MERNPTSAWLLIAGRGWSEAGTTKPFKSLLVTTCFTVSSMLASTAATVAVATKGAGRS